MDKEVGTESEKKREKNADQGGIEWGGRGGAPPPQVSVRDSRLSISGKGAATSPSTKLVLKYIELR